MKYVNLWFLVFASSILIGCGGSSSSSTEEVTPTTQVQDSQEESGTLRVACVGDSITEGTGLDDPASESYPAQLSNILGEGWEVQNFGKIHSTLLKNGSYPYWNTTQYASSLEFKPDVVVIMLGTNDTKPVNWKINDQFISDYTDLIASYKNLPSQPIIYICYPPPAYGSVAGITDTVIKNELIPKIAEVAALHGITIIDNYTVLTGKKELFPDLVHPNVEGAGIIAQNVYETIY